MYWRSCDDAPPVKPYGLQHEPSNFKIFQAKITPYTRREVVSGNSSLKTVKYSNSLIVSWCFKKYKAWKTVNSTMNNYPVRLN